jgi:hypothetical protein
MNFLIMNMIQIFLYDIDSWSHQAIILDISFCLAKLVLIIPLYIYIYIHIKNIVQNSFHGNQVKCNVNTS